MSQFVIVLLSTCNTTSPESQLFLKDPHPHLASTFHAGRGSVGLTGPDRSEDCTVPLLSMAGMPLLVPPTLHIVFWVLFM